MSVYSLLCEDIITSDLSDDADIQREIKSMFVRTNILIRKFAICSRAVKIVVKIGIYRGPC